MCESMCVDTHAVTRETRGQLRRVVSLFYLMSSGISGVCWYHIHA